MPRRSGFTFNMVLRSVALATAAPNQSILLVFATHEVARHGRDMASAIVSPVKDFAQFIPPNIIKFLNGSKLTFTSIEHVAGRNFDGQEFNRVDEDNSLYYAIRIPDGYRNVIRAIEDRIRRMKA